MTHTDATRLAQRLMDAHVQRVRTYEDAPNSGLRRPDFETFASSETEDAISKALYEAAQARPQSEVEAELKALKAHVKQVAQQMRLDLAYRPHRMTPELWMIWAIGAVFVGSTLFTVLMEIYSR
jgi:hypothetical protein